MIEYLGKIEVRKYFNLLLGEPDVFDLCNRGRKSNDTTDAIFVLCQQQFPNFEKRGTLSLLLNQLKRDYSNVVTSR